MTVTITGANAGIGLYWPGWTSASLSVTIGAGNDTWIPSTDSLSFGELPYELHTWLNDAGRPWAGAQTFDMDVAFQAPHLLITLECSGACTYAADAELQALLDFPAAGQTATAIYTQTGVPHFVVCPSDVTDWTRRQDGTGCYSRTGAWCPMPQLTAARSPAAELICDEQAAAWLTDALAGSSTDRRAWVYSSATKTWRQVYLGRVERTRAASMLYRYRLELLA